MYAYIRGNEKIFVLLNWGKHKENRNLEWIKSHILSYAIHTEVVFFSKRHHLHNVEFFDISRRKNIFKITL